MAAKNKIANVLLAKGEKIALFTAAGLLGVLLLWGAVTAMGGDSPNKTTNELASNASRVVTMEQARSGQEPPAIPERFVKGNLPEIVPPREFAHNNTRWFDPTIEPSKLWELPKVLTPEGLAQIDFIQGPMPSYDIQETPQGVRIAVVKTITVDSNKMANLRDIKKNLRNKQLRSNSNRMSQPGGPGGFGGRGPGGGMRGGGPGGFGGRGPGGGGPGSPDGGAGSPDGGGGRMGIGGPGGMGQGGNATHTEAAINYVSINEFERGQYPPAIGVYPLRMVMIQTAFPLKKQFEEIRKALKLRTLTEAIEATGYQSQGGPAIFDGIAVERRVIDPNGQAYDWAPFDHEVAYYNSIYRRKIDSAPEDPWTAYFTRYDQKLAVPLPQINDTLVSYPPIHLEAIAKEVEKLKKENRQGITPSDQSKFNGLKSGGNAEDIFNPGFGSGQSLNGISPGSTGGRGAVGPGIGGPMRPGSGGGGEGGGFGGAGPGGFGGRQGAGPGGFGGVPGGTGSPDGAVPGGGRPGGFQPPTNPNEKPKVTKTINPNDFYPLSEEYLLIRFVDPTVKPGETYQYRLRVKLKNPSFGPQFKSQVSQASYATKEVLTSAEWVINQFVPIPPETYVYALDPAEFEKSVKEKFPKDNGMQALMKVQDGKQALVQIHRWMPEVRLPGSSATEPVGAWVIGEVQAAPGEYIGRRQLCQLPIWSAEKGYYVLKELPEGYRLKGNVGTTKVPRGWLVDLSTNDILVDFDGGRYRGQIGDKTVQDESAEELLILRPDGSMFVRNSETDKDFKPRELRAKAWDEWVKTAESVTPGANPNGFDRSRPGGGGGDGGGRGD
ncbi:MAG TPA: hypothetical protein VGJ05_07445 [Fimbriiglobus sp.]